MTGCRKVIVLAIDMSWLHMEQVGYLDENEVPKDMRNMSVLACPQAQTIYNILLVKVADHLCTSQPNGTPHCNILLG